MTQESITKNLIKRDLIIFLSLTLFLTPLAVPLYHHGDIMREVLKIATFIGFIFSLAWFRVTKKVVSKVLVSVVVLWYSLFVTSIIYEIFN